MTSHLRLPTSPPYPGGHLVRRPDRGHPMLLLDAVYALVGDETRSSTESMLSMPVEISPKVPVENSPLRFCLELGVPRCSKPSRDARLGARRKRFHPLTAPALRGRWSRSGRKASRGFGRLRQVEQKAVQDAGVFGGRPRRRGVSAIAWVSCAGRRLSGIKSACWRSR